MVNGNLHVKLRAVELIRSEYCFDLTMPGFQIRPIQNSEFILSPAPGSIHGQGNVKVPLMVRF